MAISIGNRPFEYAKRAGCTLTETAFSICFGKVLSTALRRMPPGAKSSLRRSRGEYGSRQGAYQCCRQCGSVCQWIGVLAYKLGTIDNLANKYKFNRPTALWSIRLIRLIAPFLGTVMTIDFHLAFRSCRRPPTYLAVLQQGLPRGSVRFQELGSYNYQGRR